MITLRRTQERRHDRRRRCDVWLTFYPHDRPDAVAGGFGALRLLDESRLSPGARGARHVRHEAEIITYVREGGVAYEDSTGRSGVIDAGEFRLMSAGRGVRHRESNASQTEWAQAFQLGLRSSAVGLPPGHQQKRFSAGERRGGLCVVASPDARSGSLRLHHDAMLYAAILEPGLHVVHELSPGRRAWLHLVHGEVTLIDLVLTTGDSVGVAAERAISFTAREETEILLFDLGEPRPGSPDNGGVP